MRQIHLFHHEQVTSWLLVHRLVDTKVYRVTVNSFLADGGDNFTVLKEGQNRVGGGQDIDALESYVAKNSPLIIPATTRIKSH